MQTINEDSYESTGNAPFGSVRDGKDEMLKIMLDQKKPTSKIEVRR